MKYNLKIKYFSFFLSVFFMSPLLGMEGHGGDIEMEEVTEKNESVYVMNNLQLESGDIYFTPQNTQVLIVTGESIAKLIEKNQFFPAFTPAGMTLKNLLSNLNLKSFKQATGDDQQKILTGMNEFRKLEVIDQFHMHCIDMMNPNAHDLILKAVGDVVGQYFPQDARPFGFNFITLLKDETELWICEIPSRQEVEDVLSGKRKPLRAGSEDDPFTGKTQEVLSAMTMFEPLLDKLFIEGRSEEVQARRKAMWTCCKGTVAIIVIVVVALVACGGVVAAIISAASSLESSVNQP